MRTNIDLNEELVRQALQHAPVKTKKAVITLALQEFVANHQRKDLGELRASGGIAPGYDYRAMRERSADR